MSTENETLFQPDSDPDRMLTSREVCAKVGFSRRTMWVWISSRGFPKPALSVGKTFRRWRAGDVDRWLTENLDSIFN